MSQKQSAINHFTEGPVPSQLLRFAAPLFFSNLLQIVYNMVDMIIVGRVLGAVGLSAVSVAGDITNGVTFLAMGFAEAGQVIISQYVGEGNKKKIGRFTGTMYTFLFLLAVLISVSCLLLRHPILTVMNTPAESYAEAYAYLTVSLSGLIFIYGYNTASALLRGLGDSKHPFVFISMAAIMNLILDIVFVVNFSMGSRGAALATVISQGLSFIVSTAFLIKNRASYSLAVPVKEFVNLEPALLWKLVSLGIPMAIKNASIQISKLFVNSWINSYGVTVSAFSGVANKVNQITNIVSNSFNTAGSSMVGQNIGARKYDRVREIMLTIFKITFGIACIFSLCFFLFPEQIYGLFTADADVIALGKTYVPIAIIGFFGSCGRSGMNALINGSGNVKVNFATALLDGIILRIGLAVLFGLALHMRHYGFWLGDVLAGFAPFIIGLFFYRSGAWKKNFDTENASGV